MNKYHNLTVAEIVELFSRAMDAGVDAYIEGCHLLAELKRRGEHHPCMTRGVFKWFAEVESGALLASAVIQYAGDDHILSRMANLSWPEQTSLVETGVVKIAEYDRGGQIKEVEKPIVRMNLKQLDQVFDAPGKGRIRNFSQQVKILKKAEAPVRRAEPLPAAYVRDGKLFVHGRSIDPSDLIAPLRELGFSLTRKRAA